MIEVVVEAETAEQAIAEARKRVVLRDPSGRFRAEVPCMVIPLPREIRWGRDAEGHRIEKPAEESKLEARWCVRFAATTGE